VTPRAKTATPAAKRATPAAKKATPAAKKTTPAAKKTTRRVAPRAHGRGATPLTWLLLVYKVPSEPSRVRVGVWRDLKRLGSLYLQQAVAILPERPDVAEALDAIRAKIDDVGGTYHHFRLPPLEPEQEAQIVAGFRRLAGTEYSEIVEECETKFMKEIEFERFRANFTFEEAEEIRQDLEKIRRWYDRVVERDWFGGPGRAEVETWLKRCESELEAFEDEVFDKTGGADAQTE
jgi:hypothetical protein